jgi:hypothetical protein
MNLGVVGVGAFSAIIGLILLYLGMGEKVKADTPFGRHSGPIAGVLLVLGIILMALGFSF